MRSQHQSVPCGLAKVHLTGMLHLMELAGNQSPRTFERLGQEGMFQREQMIDFIGVELSA